MSRLCLPRKASVSTATIAILLSASSAFAQNPLPPGTSSGVTVPIIPLTSPPYGGTLLLELDSPIVAANSNATIRIDGFATSSVFRNDTGTLDFYYQFRFNQATNATIANVSFASYRDVADVTIAQTAIDIDGSTGLPAQNAQGVLQDYFRTATSGATFAQATRPGASGTGINVGLTTGVTGGQTTYTFVVRTAAREYSVFGSTSVQGDGISAFTSTAGAIAPFPATDAPEPGSIALLATGAVPLAIGLIRKRRKRS